MARLDRGRGGATLELDRGIAARELDSLRRQFRWMPSDFVLEYLQALTFVEDPLSRFAEEITSFATAEFGCRAAGGVLDGFQRDAAEEESGLDGVDSREGRPTLWGCRGSGRCS